MKEWWMNFTQTQALCKTLSLGTLLCPPSKVIGGQTHLMWRLTTTSGAYAVKQLTKNIDLNSAKIRQAYEVGEEIGAIFAKSGIPAITALSLQNKHLIDIQDETFLIYPWVHAAILNKDQATPQHALQMTGILTQMHTLNLYIPGLAKPEYFLYEDNQIIELIEQTERPNLPIAGALQKHTPTLLTINQAYKHSIPELQKQGVVSHGDLDIKNVLWNTKSEPFLIDWECAKQFNPVQDLLSFATDWSGVTTKLNLALFKQIIEKYLDTGGELGLTKATMGLNGVLGIWLNWLIYNIKRSLKPAHQDNQDQQLGLELAKDALTTILHLHSECDNLKILIGQVVDERHIL